MTELPYHLYGLADGNPYDHTPLNPLETPGDENRLLDLDGFFAPDRVERYLRRKVKNEEPAFILIGGRDWSGRTSPANWVLHTYFALRGVGPRSLPVNVPVTDQGAFWSVRKAMSRLWAKLEQTPDLTVNQKVLDGIEKCRAAKDEEDYEEPFQVRLGNLWTELTHREEPWAMGFVFEGVGKPPLVGAARTPRART